jgi:hypothetical protein
MGEPIGDFVLRWEPLSVRISDHGSKATSNYSVVSLPAPLAKAATRLEMYIDAVAFVQKGGSGSNYGNAALAFNTGVATRPGETSMNVPGGYNWDKFLISSMSSKGTGYGLGGWCVAEGRQQLSAADAKAVMRAGVKLDLLQICPASSVDVSAIENAIAKMCEGKAPPLPPYCAKPESRAPAQKLDSIEAGFAKLEPGNATPAPKERKTSSSMNPIDIALESAETERQRRKQEEQKRQATAERERVAREEASQFCSAAKAKQDNCAKNTCGSQPDAEICTDRREEPFKGCPGGAEKCLVFPKFICYARGPNPKLAEWNSCLISKNKECLESRKVITSVDQCILDRLK